MTAAEADKPGPGASHTATVPRIAGAEQLARRARVPRPALQGLLVLAVYLAVFVIGYGLSLLLHPGLPQVGQTEVDPNFYVWSWRWWPYAISHGLNPLYSRQIGAPAGFDLAWTTTAPAVAVILIPVTAAFGPITSANLVLLLAAPVSAWVAFLAARRLTGRFWAALVAGAVYGFSPYEVGHIASGQTNLAVIMLLPLMLYLALLWRDGKLGDAVFVGLMAVTMAAEFYIFDEAYAEVAALWAVGLLIGFAVARPADRKTVARLAGLITIAFGASIVLASPYLVYALRHYPAGFTKSGAGLHLERLVDPPVGILLLVIVLALAVLTWSSRLTRLLVILFVLLAALAIGPHPIIGTKHLGPVPWAPLWSLPIARSAEPMRLMLFGYLVLAIIVAVWLSFPTGNRLLLASRWILGLATVAALLAYHPTVPSGSVNPPSAPSAAVRPDAPPAFISAGLYRHYLRPGEIVLVVSDRGNAGMLFQADTDFYFRIAGGFINVSVSNTTALPEPVARLRHPTPARERRFRAYVHRAGVGAILVERAWAAPWMQVFSRMGLHGTSAGGMIIYRIP